MSGKLFIDDETNCELSIGNDKLIQEFNEVGQPHPVFTDELKTAFTGTCTTVNMNLVDELSKPSNASQFDVEWQIPILTNARWHKKTRIRKKWLKRYGYKEDTIKVTSLATNVSHTVDCDCGVFNMDVDSIEYVLRPDQLRRGLDIIMEGEEW